MAARTPSKAESAIKDIQAAVPGASVSFLGLDLTSFASIAEAARAFTSQSQRLDVLINNAGIMATPAGTTKEDYEIQFGTNHMGHALLTKLLLPTLLATAERPHSDVRIINLTSEGHNLAPSGGLVLDKTKLDAQGTWARYGHSKLANILYTRELAAHYPTITSVAIHPGIIKTDLYEPNKGTNVLLRYGMSLLGPLIFASLQDGAKNQIWAATTKKEDLQNGAYYKPIASLSTGSGNAQNKELAKTLWSWTQEELEKKGY